LKRRKTHNKKSSYFYFRDLYRSTSTIHREGMKRQKSQSAIADWDFSFIYIAGAPYTFKKDQPYLKQVALSSNVKARMANKPS